MLWYFSHCVAHMALKSVCTWWEKIAYLEFNTHIILKLPYQQNHPVKTMNHNWIAEKSMLNFNYFFFNKHRQRKKKKKEKWKKFLLKKHTKIGLPYLWMIMAAAEIFVYHSQFYSKKGKKSWSGLFSLQIWMECL